MVKKLEVFLEKNCKKTSEEKFRIKKYLKEKAINCMSNGKDMMIHLLVGLIKKNSHKNDSILS